MERIQIIGAGAVGMLLGSFFAQMGKHVHFVCRRQAQVYELRKGLLRESLDGFVESFLVSASCMLLQDADLTIVTVKSKDVEQSISNIPKKMPTLFIQNGLAHIEIVKRSHLLHTAFSSVQFGATKKSDHLVSQRGIGVIKIAKGTLPENIYTDLLASSMENFPIEAVQDAEQMLYEKAIFNSLINPLTAVCMLKNGELLTNEFAYATMKQMYEELQNTFPDFCPTFEDVCKLCERTAANTSSMLADHLVKRKSEVREIVGVLIQEANEKKIQLPTVQTVYNLILAKEISEGFDE